MSDANYHIRHDREERLKTLAAQRQEGLTVVLENVHDPHNIGAVIRTCDSVGIHEIFVLLTDPRIDPSKYKIGKGSSSGTNKWVKVHLFHDVDECFDVVRADYDVVLGTKIDPEANSIFDQDLIQSTALVFGNEHEGISDQVSQKVDRHVYLPQFGMARSLNISVACAICLYESCRQRMNAKLYDVKFNLHNKFHRKLYKRYLDTHHKSRIERSKSFEEKMNREIEDQRKSFK